MTEMKAAVPRNPSMKDVAWLVKVLGHDCVTTGNSSNSVFSSIYPAQLMLPLNDGAASFCFSSRGTSYSDDFLFGHAAFDAK